MPATDRHPKRLCEVCLQYDDHPRIVLGVTTEGPLGNHTPGEIGQVAALLAPLLPENAAGIDRALLGQDPAEQERIMAELIPDPDQYDAYRAWRQFLHPQHFDGHLDCYTGLHPDLQPQLAIDAFKPILNDANEVIGQEQVGWEDKRKIMPSDHALEQVGKLKGADLREHLTADPAHDVDLAHGTAARS